MLQPGFEASEYAYDNGQSNTPVLSSANEPATFHPFSDDASSSSVSNAGENVDQVHLRSTARYLIEKV